MTSGMSRRCRPPMMYWCCQSEPEPPVDVIGAWLSDTYTLGAVPPARPDRALRAAARAPVGIGEGQPIDPHDQPGERGQAAPVVDQAPPPCSPPAPRPAATGWSRSAAPSTSAARRSCSIRPSVRSRRWASFQQHVEQFKKNGQDILIGPLHRLGDVSRLPAARSSRASERPRDAELMLDEAAAAQGSKFVARRGLGRAIHLFDPAGGFRRSVRPRRGQYGRLAIEATSLCARAASSTCWARCWRSRPVPAGAAAGERRPRRVRTRRPPQAAAAVISRSAGHGHDD